MFEAQCNFDITLQRRITEILHPINYANRGRGEIGNSTVQIRFAMEIRRGLAPVPFL